MESQCYLTIRLPFVVGEEELKKLARLLSDRIGEVEFVVYCADDITRTFKALNDLASFENTKAKEIRRIRLEAHSDDSKKRATITFSGLAFEALTLDFTGRDDVVARLREEALDIIAGTRPWYTILYRIDLFLFIFPAIPFFVLWIGVLVYQAIRNPPPIQNVEADTRTTALAHLLLLGIIFLPYFFSVVLFILRNKAFPRAVFKIGQGEDRFALLVNIQWVVVIGFLVSLAAGVVLFLVQMLST